MRYLQILLVLQFFSFHSSAQVLNDNNSYNPLYQNFQNSYYSFNQDYSTQEDYYQQLEKRVKQKSKDGTLRKINGPFQSNYIASNTQDSFPTILEPVSDILTKVPNIGNAPSVQCEVTEKVEVVQPETIPFNATGLPKGFNSKCANFIKSDGTIGTWGNHIKKYIEADNTLFFSPALPGMQSIPRTCPNWGKLDNEAKTHFWIWMIASIAQVESSCKSDAVNTGTVPNPTDRPRGLLQLNTLKKSRSWRGANCKFPSDHASVNDPKNNILCGLDIMKEILKGKKGEYKTNGKIFPTNSYWEKLRPNHSKTGGPIGKLARDFKPCGATP